MSCLTVELPKDFQSSLDVVSCYVMYGDKILLLFRHIDRQEGSKYGPPAGKVIGREGLRDAMIREISEESGIHVQKEKLNFVRTYYVRHPSFDYTYHVFRTNVSKEAQVYLSPREHTGFKWVTPNEALSLPLVTGEDESIRLTFGLDDDI